MAMLILFSDGFSHFLYNEVILLKTKKLVSQATLLESLVKI